MAKAKKATKKAAKKRFGKCGFLALIVLIFMGTLFGLLGVLGVHILVKFFLDEYYLIFGFPTLLGIVLGLGCYLGCRMGRCSRLSLIAFLLVTIFSVVCYGALLFFNQYYDTLVAKEGSVTITKEFANLKVDIQNLLADLPYVTDYITPVEDVERENFGNQALAFVKTLPELAMEEVPVVIGTALEYPPFTYINQYLEHPGITRWENQERGILVFDENAVKPWMLWAGELTFLWLIVLLFSKRGTRRAFDAFQERMKKHGGWQPARDQKSGFDMTPAPSKGKKPETEAKPKKKKRGFFGFGRKKTVEPSAEEVGHQEAVAPESDEAAEDQPGEKKKKKKKRGWFGGKSKKPEEASFAVESDVQPESGTPAPSNEAELDWELPQEEKEEQAEELYALILHQYNSERERDLLQLTQQVAQIPEEQARRLLKTPSLLKQGVTKQQAQITVEKFKQLQAQLKLITMEQLQLLQRKQQKTAQPSQKSPPPPTPKASDSKPGEQYALILRKFDQSQRKSVLELLSSLSNTPIEQLQQGLKTPALVLRDSSKNEVTMIAQQFQQIQAEVKILSMSDLKKLMAKK